MVGTDDGVGWVASRIGIPILAFVVLIGIIIGGIYWSSKKEKRKRKAGKPLVNKTRVIPFYSSVIEERRTKHLRSHSAQLTPPAKYLRQSPSHRHFRRNSSPTMSPYTKRESLGEAIDTTAPKIAKLLEAYSLFPIQPPSHLKLDSPGKKYSGSQSNKSRHLTPRGTGYSNLLITSPRMPVAHQTPLINPEEKQ